MTSLGVMQGQSQRVISTDRNTKINSSIIYSYSNYNNVRNSDDSNESPLRQKRQMANDTFSNNWLERSSVEASGGSIGGVEA